MPIPFYIALRGPGQILYSLLSKLYSRGGDFIAEENSMELASRVSYEVVKELAPRELILFDDFKEKFQKNPDAFAEKDRKKREKMLGFAVPAGTTEFMTAFVLPIALGAVNKYFEKRANKKLDSNQLESLRNDAYNNAIALGVDKEKAELMADALVGKMLRLSGVK